MPSMPIHSEDQYTYKLSVIVAVYNVAAYLDECLSSLHRQKRTDVEFIVVDDGSTDASSAICDQWAAQDVRFKVIHQENKGSLLARKTGVMHSSGQWITFLDGDDLFADDALEHMCSLADNCDADIIQFSIDVFNCNNKDQHDNVLEDVNKPEKILKNETICASCFQKKSISWTLWNRIYKSSLIKKSYAHIKDIYLICATDAYTFFIITFFASKLFIKKTTPLYFYCLNTGVSTSRETIDLFTKHLSEITIIEHIRGFLTIQAAEKSWFDACTALQTTLTNTAVYRMATLPEKDLPAALSLFFDTYDPVVYLPTLQNVFSGRQDTLARAAHTAFKQKDVRDSQTAHQRATPTEKKTVGIFYHRYFNGGVERVISQQIPIFLKLGYRVVLFTEQVCPEKEYPLPSEIIRVIVPNSYAQGRASVFLTALREYDVDVLCHHAWLSQSLLLDLLLCHTAGVSCILTCHGTMLTNMAAGIDYPFNPPILFILASTVCILSSLEAYFYQQCGVNARYLPNPVVAPPEAPANITSRKVYRPTVIWVGRLSEEKNYKEALHIFKQISEQRHDVLCYMVGSGEGNDSKYVQKFIYKNKLQNNITYIPYTQNVDQFYKLSTVHLITSSFEGFPMVMAEGKIYGLPLVTYALPWLELLKEDKGYISVQPHDVKGAADAVITILNDEWLQQRLSHEALESIQPFLEYDFASAWKELLESPQRTQPGVYQGEVPSNMHLLYDHILFTYREGRLRILSRFSNKEAIKKLLKNIPFIDNILPIGSRRRDFVKRAVKSVFGNF